MEIKELEQIIGILKNTDITEFEIDHDGTHLKLSRGPKGVVVQNISSDGSHQHQFTQQPTYTAAPQVAAPVAAAPAAPDTSKFTKVESPLVGTFYRKPSPDAQFFCKEGDTVKKGDTLCIIEAMKLMNEVESPADGKIVKIQANDGKVVEFGQVLFLIDPTA